MTRCRLRTVLPFLLFVASCGTGEPHDDRREFPAEIHDAGGSGVVVVDARGDTVVLPGPAERILSLVPSVTQMLDRMGAAHHLVGRTDYDTLTSIAHLPSVGGGLGPNLEIVRTLDPQVVITFAGESDLRTSRGLRALGIAEVAVRPDRLADIPPIVEILGLVTGRSEDSRTLAEEMTTELGRVRATVASLPPVRAAYLLGGSPPLAASPGTFISDLVELAGGRNVLQDLDGLYAPVSPEILRIRPIDVLLVGQGGHLDERITVGRRVAEIPSWVEVPGPHLGAAAWIVARALHPELAEKAP